MSQSIGAQLSSHVDNHEPKIGSQIAIDEAFDITFVETTGSLLDVGLSIGNLDWYWYVVISSGRI